MTNDAYNRVPKGFFTNLLDRVTGLERRLAVQPVIPPPYVLPNRIGTFGQLVTDCNDALEAGWYYGVSPTNGPTTTGLAHLFVYRAGSTNNAIRQEFRRIFADSGDLTGGATDNRVWIRTSVDSGVNWTPWRREPRGPHTGSTTERNAHRPDYLEEWYDSTLQQLFVGSKTGTWRRKSGLTTFASAAWTSSATSGSVINAARTINLTIPTFLETNETLAVTLVDGGSGFTFLSLNTMTKNATDTDIAVRYAQLFSTTNQGGTILWQVTPG